MFKGIAITVFIIFMVVLVERLWKRSRRKQDKRSARLRIAGKVSSFAELYVDRTKANFRPAVIPDDDIVAFRKIVVDQYELDLDWPTLQGLINDEVFRQESAHFERSLQGTRQGRPDLEQLITAYIRIYGGNMAYVPYLVELCRRCHIDVTARWLTENIPGRIKAAELDSHAQKILDRMDQKHKLTHRKTVEELDQLKPEEFAEFFRDAFDVMGYIVGNGAPADSGRLTLTIEKVGDVDLVLVVQAETEVHVEVLKDAEAARRANNCGGTIIVTNSLFTKQARDQAAEQKVRLWDREKLGFLIDLYQKEKL